MNSRACLWLLVLAFGLALQPAGAQETAKKKLSFESSTLAPFGFFPRAMRGLKWHGDGEHFSYLERKDKTTRFVLESTKDGKKTVLVEGKAFGLAATAAGLKGLALGSLAGASWLEQSMVMRLDWRGKRIDVGLSPLGFKTKLEYPAKAEATTTTKDGGQIAYVLDHDVYVKKRSGTEHRITSSGFKHLTHGVAVHRVEFGITDGLWWDPTGRRLAFYREDLRVVDPYPIVDWTKTPARLSPGHYPMAGTPNGLVSIGIYDSRDDSLLWLDVPDDSDDYLTNVAWGPQGDRLYVAHVARGQDRMTLKSYNAVTGKHDLDLFSERDEQWTEPEHGPIFLPTQDNQFLWFSPRDGFNKLYLYASDGQLLQQVTTGDYDVAAFKGLDATGLGFYFEACGDDPRQKHLFHQKIVAPKYEIKQAGVRDLEMKLNTMAAVSLTGGRGQHNAQVSSNGRWVLDRHSNLELPLAIDLLDGKSHVHRRLHTAKNPLADYDVGTESFFVTKTEDGQKLYGHQILPPRLDPNEKHPVLLYVYSGPHSQFVRDEWMGGLGGTNLWLHYMATKGFICFRVDGRGTLNRGIEWQQCIHRQLGKAEIKDQVAGLAHILKTTPADASRVGVTGWSYGGFMTLSLMSRAGKHFAAGVAGAPVTDWSYYETGYGERYMDQPRENVEGYKLSDPGNHVKGIEGRLLVVQGSSDATVVWQHTINFLGKCIKAGVDVDYFVYPGQLHGLRGKNREHFYRKMTRFFERELNPKSE